MPKTGRRTGLGRWAPPLQRFYKNVKWSRTGCLLWMASKNPVSGYAGPFMGDGRTQAAHKWIYEYLIGPVTKGLDLDHKCRVRHCVNVNHLEPVTRKENVARGVGPVVSSKRAYQIICKRGHPLLNNVHVRKNGERSCAECANAKRRERRARAKQELSQRSSSGT